MQKNAQEYIISSEKELDEIAFSLIPGDRIFFSGDLGVGKSTFIRSLIRKYMNDPNLIVRSPTYTYYQKYDTKKNFTEFRISQKQEVQGRENFSKGTYKGVSNQEKSFSNEEIRSFSEIPIYHCDLYRLEDYSTWISIGGEEIAQDPDSIMLIEWPEILGSSIVPTKTVSIEVMETRERRIRIG